ncbi:AGCS family alanine or glycine:cation symporter [Thiohalophilus thiocyanatoxydans]|uniref:AGCS family alanine or glycine:cation symporter n=1 Tax=Thiohalophilus thiocyanatoxydans TaxID=381308 RepID=A0A4R8IMX2_9GAMM|nr:sodium:alanine symporter family protein [Thiohalophilus thiocyanatoxydans]TDX97905.1 AGCS family alanine or glycine:cation symporter [Thiohalophilus thiocyanatoxydans]
MDNLLAALTEWTGTVSDYAWGIPSIVLLVGTGLYLTFRLRFVQLRGFKHAWQIIRGNYDKPHDPGEVSHFQALSTALSATVGTGNIAGVATAIAFGGPGAVFWMWITALVGMATKFASCSLAVKFRRFHPDGSVSGGPMYTLLYGLNFKTLAILFAAFTLIASFGIGNMVQANSVVDGLSYVFPGAETYRLGIGVIIAILVGLVIIGGIKRIARVTSRIVPFMAVFYCAAALVVLFLHIERIPAAFATIFNLALNPWAAGGGAIGAAIQYGVARGIFSNEAGLGSAPMAHAAARTDEPVREGLVAMMGPFIDTIVICTMTALVIVIMGAWGEARPEGLEGAALSAHAFEQGLGSIGGWIVGIGLTFFAYSTMIAWSYYGDRSAEFLFGERAVMPYRVIFTVLVVVGAYVPLQLVWNFADIANILMAAPNLISLILLAGLAKTLSDDYFRRMPG